MWPSELSIELEIRNLQKQQWPVPVNNQLANQKTAKQLSSHHTMSVKATALLGKFNISSLWSNFHAYGL